jgi:phenylalanyl-tRNA synthetase alpha chain
MEHELLIKGLHPLEIRLLLHFGEEEEIGSARVQEELSFNLGQCNQAFSWLVTKGLAAEKSREVSVEFSLTALGQAYQKEGLPEERILELLASGPALTLPELAARLGLEKSDVGSAYGALAKAGLAAMNESKQVVVNSGSPSAALAGLRTLLDRAAGQGFLRRGELTEAEAGLAASLSRKRGAGKSVFRMAEKEEILYVLTPLAAEVQALLRKQGVTGEEIGAITPELLQSGEWKNRNFRGYNLAIPPLRVMLGRKNPYVEFLEQLKNKLAALGFEEYDGPLLESEFWNSDALFMPQFHSARDIHDVYYTKEPSHAREIEQPYLDQVAATHTDGWDSGSLGWRYAFDRDFTRRMILRSHGTVLSAKALTYAKIPGKYFGVVRCFRYDRVDATHLADFYQTEGIVLGEEVNLRTLLGLLKMFAEEVAGAKEVKYVPGYFPFTEPSVEVHIRHPELGWFELGGSGIFRPEVTRPLGIQVPVLAWGLGIDRMALMALGLNDLRELFTPDIEQVRLRRRK